jgi:uncharacterized membrane-anchored protein YhcB (DUF1043 family)
MTPNDAQPAPHHRRSREEVEALAKNFIGAPVEEGAPAKSRIPLLAAAAGGAIVLAVIAFVAMPDQEVAEAPRATPEQSRAAAEAEAMRQRFEAERERKRKELAASSAYMEKMAAADAQLLKDMSSQAEMLASRVAAKPAAESEPTPREAAPQKSAPAPTTTLASAPAKPAPTAAAAPQPPAKTEPAPAAAAPVQVAQVDKSQCSIHVSELSKSGKLTYADVARMKGARLDADTGHVFTPPVEAGGRRVVFEVMPTGCVRLRR